MVSYPEPTDVVLTLSNLHLECDEGCKMDYLSFYAGDLEQGGKVHTEFICCERSNYRKYFYNVTNFTIKFQANENLQYSGFDGALVPNISESASVCAPILVHQYNSFTVWDQVTCGYVVCFHEITQDY